MTTPPPSPPSPLLTLSRFAWILPAEGLLFAWLRHRAQGGSDTYTQLNKQFYVEGGLTGWQLSPDTFLWLGKDALILLAASLLGVAAFGWLANRLARAPKSPTQPSKTAPILAILALLGAAPSLAAPLLLVPKLPPADALATLPTDSGASADARPGSFARGDAGRYTVAPYTGNLITAQLRAGGDTFEVKLPSVTGDASFDPMRLDAAPISASFSASLKSLSSGIEARDNHARDYLKADQHPALSLSFSKLTHNTVEPSGDLVHFEADAQLSMMGQTLSLPVKGSLKALTPDAVTAAGLPNLPTFLLDASLSLLLKDSPLQEHANDFDQPDQPIPIRATFILQRAQD